MKSVSNKVEGIIGFRVVRWIRGIIRAGFYVLEGYL